MSRMRQCHEAVERADLAEFVVGHHDVGEGNVAGVRDDIGPRDRVSDDDLGTRRSVGVFAIGRLLDGDAAFWGNRGSLVAERAGDGVARFDRDRARCVPVVTGRRREVPPFDGGFRNVVGTRVQLIERPRGAPGPSTQIERTGCQGAAREREDPVAADRDLLYDDRRERGGRSSLLLLCRSRRRECHRHQQCGGQRCDQNSSIVRAMRTGQRHREHLLPPPLFVGATR
jgi:hypothetical protein